MSPEGPANVEQPPPGRYGILVLGLGGVALVGLGTRFGFGRALIALGIFTVIAYFGSRQIRSMVSIPPEPEVTDVSSYRLRYVCSMCGLELKVEVAAKDRAPTHCMEPMVLSQDPEPRPS